MIQKHVDIINKDIRKEHSQLNDMIETNHLEFELTAKATRFKSIIKFNSNVNLNIENIILSVLGFSKHILKASVKHYLDKVVCINAMNSIQVLSNKASGSFHNSNPSHSIYEFYPAVFVGLKVVENPKN